MLNNNGFKILIFRGGKNPYQIGTAQHSSCTLHFKGDTSLLSFLHFVGHLRAYRSRQEKAALCGSDIANQLKLNFTQRSSFSNCDRWNGAYSGSCWSTRSLRSSYTHGPLRKKPINVTGSTVIVFKTPSDIFYSPVALIFPFLPEVPLVLAVPVQSHMSGVHHSDLSLMCFTFCGHDWCAAYIKYLQEAHLAQLPMGRYIH